MLIFMKFILTRQLFISLRLCILTVMYVLFCVFCFHRANWHSSATLTEVFPCFFSSVVRQMAGYNSHRRGTACTLTKLIVLFCVTVCVQMCTVLLPPGGNPIAVNKYISLRIYRWDGRLHSVPACSAVESKLGPDTWAACKISSLNSATVCVLKALTSSSWLLFVLLS